mgnify:CR=1 FL=1
MMNFFSILLETTETEEWYENDFQEDTKSFCDEKVRTSLNKVWKSGTIIF